VIYDQRVIWDDDGTEKDMSSTVNDFLIGSYEIAFTGVDDALYIASDIPFNHRFIMMDVANDETITASVYIWYNNEWVAAVDVFDGTSSGGASLATDGILEWTTNRLKGWSREADSEDVDGLDKVGIYDKYWLRVNFSSDFKATTSIKYIGQRFSTDTELFALYPDLNNASLMAAYATGKTGWVDQHIIASESIARDLKRKNIIYNEKQILNHHLFQEASCHKVAEIVYAGLGRAFDDNRARARKHYQEAMELNYYNIDRNASGNLEETEKLHSQRFMYR